MQVKTLVSILALSTAFAFAGPSFAQTMVNGVEVSADDLPKVQARCAEIMTSAESESLSQDNDSKETSENAAAADATTSGTVPQVDAAAQATSTFDLDTLNAELCAGVPAAAM